MAILSVVMTKTMASQPLVTCRRDQRRWRCFRDLS